MLMAAGCPKKNMARDGSNYSKIKLVLRSYSKMPGCGLSSS
jgi:hypothetical protein